MADEIRVMVASYGSGRNLMMVHFDPVTGKRVTKSSGTTDRRQAERAAAVWQDELNSGRYQAPSRLTWAEFRRRYETEKLPALAPRTQTTVAQALDCLETIINPDRLVKLTAAVMSRFQAELRKPREVVRRKKKIVKPAMKDVTIAHHLRHIRAALSWGVSMGMLAKVPDMHMPKRTKGQVMMRGRAITEEEFDRLIAAVPKVRPHDAPAWERLLRGLWLSGLRLGKAVALSWDQEAPFQADMTGRRPAFRIYAEAQKAHRDEVLPATPDFAQWLMQTPQAEREGLVFKLARERGGKPMGLGKVGAVVSKIGKTAGVVVNKAEGKFASAHDLRRAFGTRWSRKVMPAVLKRLMRHSAIQTTMTHYVDLDAAEVADQLWAAYEKAPANDNTFDNNGQKTAETAEADEVVTNYAKRS
jgi:integrase